MAWIESLNFLWYFTSKVSVICTALNILVFQALKSSPLKSSHCSFSSPKFQSSSHNPQQTKTKQCKTTTATKTSHDRARHSSTPFLVSTCLSSGLYWCDGHQDQSNLEGNGLFGSHSRIIVHPWRKWEQKLKQGRTWMEAGVEKECTEECYWLACS